MARYDDKYWWSGEGLRLHYRDYAADAAHADRPALLCLPGLTRNARDYARFAERYAGEWRVICPEMRGRGESAYAKDPMTYVPLTYVQDLERLLADIAPQKFVAVGTSLGGILTMIMAPTHRDRLAGALINDVGPTIEEAGLDRIRHYVGTGGSHLTWVHAARAVAETQARNYPDYTLEDWLGMAKRLYRLNSSGRIVLDYDMRIAEPFKVPGNESGVDMWPVMAAFRDLPTLILRGELSDLMSEATGRRMEREIGASADYVVVPQVGHTPTLEEPEAVAGVERLLARVLARG
ncbi:MAG: alpha/beta hydrolase [Sphingobium sp.]|jgi:pimeloyl-ACP methyl ester carboxylesterase|nr:alpha/beta hydrolase [Sphingobium sp.]MCI2053694.1 alpha/beta hydrolase [Sphingobium sp.]